MHLCNTIKILFFLLFELKGIQSISLENDITKLVDIWIAKILEIDAKTAINLFDTISEYQLKEFEYNLTQKMSPFQTKVFFENVEFKTNTEPDKEPDQNTVKPSSSRSDESDESGESEEWKTPEIYWKFSENKIEIFFERLLIEAKGTICTKKNEPYVDFITYMGILNTTFSAVAYELPTNPSRLHISSNFTYYDFCVSFDENEDIHWVKVGAVCDMKQYNDDLKDQAPVEYYDYENSQLPFENSTHEEARPVSSDEQQEGLTEEITSVLPLMIGENLHHNEEFIYKVKKIFRLYQKPEKQILSKHPDLWTNSQQFHYLIPKINYLSFTLKRIVISGLWNLDSLKVHKASGVFTHTLFIKNVEGCMTLDYRSENEAPLKLYFHVDCLYISIRQDTKCVFVQAQYYHVTRVRSNTSLPSRQAEALIHGLESAIASSILPWMEVGKLCELKSPVEEITITNMTDWKTVKELYKWWIPFNDDIDNSSSTKFPFNTFQC